MAISICMRDVNYESRNMLIIPRSDKNILSMLYTRTILKSKLLLPFQCSYSAFFSAHALSLRK